MKKILLIILIAITGTTVFAQSYRGQTQKTPEDKLNEKYCTGLFKSAHGTIFDIQNEPSASGYLNILDWLQGRIAGLQIYTHRTGTRVPYIRGNVATIFVDEMQMDARLFSSMPFNDIAMIKVIKTPFAGSFGNRSAIAIYTIETEEEDEE
jgi:hypothetical protein